MMEHIRCDYCGADNPRLLFEAADTNYHRPGTFRIVRCGACRLVYLDPRPDAASIGLYYPDRDYPCYLHEREPAPFNPHDPLVRLVGGIQRRPVRLCDVGCGDGHFLLAARRTGWDVAGVEVNAYARRRCVERVGSDVVYPSLEEADFGSETFDVVTLWHVLEHLPSPSYALGEARRILRPGGVLALAVPNFGSLESFVWRQHWIYLMAPTHFYHFTRPTLRRYLTAQGFAVMETRQEGGPSSLSANLLRTLRVALLDPIARRRHTADTESVASSSFSPETVNWVGKTAVGQVDDATKRRLNRLTTTLVSPGAWLIDNVGCGPELKVYSRKVERTQEWSR